MNRFRALAYKVGKNHTRTVWVLKCDIQKFFASIDQRILIDILRQYIPDPDVIWLIRQVVRSFNSGKLDKGLPLGNLTSQLLVNIYMNEFDQFVKHLLKIQSYIRYADDFVILSPYKSLLESLIPKVASFLKSRLALTLHPNKVLIKTVASGVDFLGWVHFTDHRVLRTATKRRVLRNLNKNDSEKTVQSYFGLLRHGNTNKLKEKITALALAFYLRFVLQSLSHVSKP